MTQRQHLDSLRYHEALPSNMLVMCQARTCSWYGEVSLSLGRYKSGLWNQQFWWDQGKYQEPGSQQRGFLHHTVPLRKISPVTTPRHCSRVCPLSGETQGRAGTLCTNRTCCLNWHHHHGTWHGSCFWFSKINLDVMFCLLDNYLHIIIFKSILIPW